MSQNDIDIRIKTAVDGQKELTEYQKELIKLGRSSQEVDAQVEVLGETLSDLSKAVKLKEKLSEASEELEVASDNLEKAREAYKRASEEAAHFSKTSDPKAVKDMNKALVDQEKELKSLEQAQSKAQKKYADTNKTIDQYNANIQKLVNNTDHYNESVQKAENAQAKLNTELKNLKEVGEAYQKLGVQDLEKEIKDLENAYKVLKDSGKLSATELKDAHQKLTDEVEKYKKTLNGTDQAYKDLKKGSLQILPIAAALTKVTKSAIDYEDKMADVKKVITATDEEFKELSNSLLEMSKITPVSAAGLAEIAAAGAQLGVEVVNLKEFVTITADMATAFDMTAENAGNAVASLSNIFGISINDTEKLGDAINHLSNNSAANARQIVDVLVRIGGTGKAIGLTQQEVAALGSTLISFGKSPEIAGTALDAFLVRLQTLNSLGPTGQESLNKIGVSAVQMSQMINENASEAIVHFLEQVNTLNNTEKAGALTNIFGRGPQADILLMASNIESLKKQLDLVGDSSKYLGSMQKEAKARADTTANQLELLKNNVNVLSISLGNQLLPVLNSTVSGLNGVVDAVGAITGQFPEITKYIILLGTAATSLKLLSASFKLASINALGMMASIKASASAILVKTKIMTSATVATKGLAVAIASLSASAVVLTGGLIALNKWMEAYEDKQNAKAASLAAEIEQQKIAQEYAKRGIILEEDGTITIKNKVEALSEYEKAIAAANQKEKERAAALEVVNAILAKTGKSFEEIQTNISKSSKEVIDDLNKIATSGVATSRVISYQLAEALKTVKTPEEMNLLIANFNSLTEQGNMSSAAVILFKDELNKLNESYKNGVITEAEFLDQKSKVIDVLDKQYKITSSVNAEISKQVQLINTQIALDKKLLDSTVRKLEAEKEMAKAMSDTVRMQELDRQIQAVRIGGMKDETKLLAKRTEEHKKELLVLESRKANGEALTEAEEQRIRSLKNEIEVQYNEIEAINKSAEAKEYDIAMSHKNASALDGLAKSANNAASAQQNVASSISKTGDEAGKTSQRGAVFSSWLKGMADESKKSSAALDSLKKSMVEANNAAASDRMSLAPAYANLKIRQLEALKNEIIYQIKKSESIEDEMQKGSSMGIDAINAMAETVKSLGYVNEEITKSMTDNLERMRNEAKNTYAEIDRENADMINNLTVARNQNEMHQLRMKQINERASLESKIMQAQEDGDSVREKKLRDQMLILQQVQNQEQRMARNERQAKERDKNQKIDVNLNGTQLKNLDPNNKQDMDRIAAEVVNLIVKDQKKSTQFVIKDNRRRP